MKTFDAAIRVQRRETDSLSVSIRVEIERMESIASQRDQHAAAEIRERAAASEIWIPTDAWAARMRAERAQLARSAAESDQRLTVLRSQAAESYGRLRAIEQAAENRREELERIQATVEQAAADDFGTARFLAARNQARRRLQ
jgi:hypothetical protein